MLNRNYMFFVYIIYSPKLDRFYIGSTDNFDLRIIQHNSVLYQDSFTSKGIPWDLFLNIECNNSAQAYNIEKHIKKMKLKNYIQKLKQNLYWEFLLVYSLLHLIYNLIAHLFFR